jgi:hypothetical protein
MDPVCHRCGTALNSPDELFCPHCGAPQLRYEPADEPANSVTVPQTAGRNLESFSSRTAILSALVIAALVAIPTGLLSSIYDFSRILVLIGGIATVMLYRRRAGTVPTGRLGWRIGGLAGLLAAFISLALYSVRSVIQRFAMHSDEPGVQARLLAQQFAAAANQASHTNPQTADAAARITRFSLSPDGAAAMALLTAVLFTFTFILFAAAGGAIGARIISVRNRPQRSSR